jgi:dolichol-phosphate mannosyltransferase
MPRRLKLQPREAPRLLSIVIPMYDEEGAIPHLRKRMEQLKPQFGCPIELLVVDDGSRDATIDLLTEWAQDDPDVKLIALSRNFGHQLATSAGLHFARGDAIVIMDADLQDPPEVVLEMIKGYCEGYDVVYGQRTDREGETWFKLATARLFYYLMRKFVVRTLPANTGDFRLMSRRVLEDLKRLREHDRFLRGLVAWVGYHQKALPYRRHARSAGKTKYPFTKMVKFAMNAIISFSDLPLRMIIWLGLSTVLLSFFLILRVLFLYFFGPEALVPGYTSLSIMICFFSGTILVALGMLGLYVGRIYTEVLARPLFLVSETMNLESKSTEAASKP